MALYWAEILPYRYKKLGISPYTKITIELARLERRKLGYQPVLWPVHDDFADYHLRFQHENAILTCSCKEEKSLDHFYY